MCLRLSYLLNREYENMYFLWIIQMHHRFFRLYTNFLYLSLDYPHDVRL